MTNIAIVIALLVIGFASGYTWEYQNYADVKAVLESERKQAKADADQARSDSERITGDVSRAWSRAYSYLHDHPRSVRVLRTGDCVQNANAGGSTGTPATPANPEPAPTGITSQECENYLNAAIEDVVDLVWFQNWYKKQREALK